MSEGTSWDSIIDFKRKPQQNKFQCISKPILSIKA